MEGEHLYYSIYKEFDFPDKSMYGFTRFDSQRQGNCWHRAVITLKKEANIEVWLYASDDDEVNFVLKECTYNKSGDILLHQYKGRYLYVKIYCEDSQCGFIMQIYPLAHSFVRYLPEIYHDADFTSFFMRYMAVFQSIYLDMEETIMHIPELLDPRIADKTQLQILADWLACEEISFFQEKRARELLLKCVKFYQKSGTKMVIKQIIEWLLQPIPQIFVIEHFQIKKYLSVKTIELHYGANPFFFTIIVWRKDIRINDISLVRQMIQCMKPCHCDFQLVSLENKIKLDAFTYLGMNSIISTYEEPILDEAHHLSGLLLKKVLNNHLIIKKGNENG